MTSGDSPDRLPLVLLPGLDGTGHLFSRFMEALPESLTPIVVPLPCDRPRGYAELTEQVRGRLPVGARFAVLGESFSGPIALRLAAERPEGLVAVVLVASFHRRPVAGWLAALSLAARPLFSIPPPPALLRRFLAGPGASAKVVTEIRAAVGEVPPSVLAARVRAALAEDSTAALADCPVPLLYLGGTRDRLLRPTLAEEFRQVLPATRLGWLEAPHLVLQLAPREAAGVVSEFLLRGDASAPRLPGPG